MRRFEEFNSKFDHVVAAVKESNNLSIFSFYELIDSWRIHEARMNQSNGKNGEKTFEVKREDKPTDKGHGSGLGGGSFTCQNGYKHSLKNAVQCCYCNKYGHAEGDCW